MEQFFVLLVVGVFAFLNWLVKQSGSKPPQQGAPRRPPPRPVGPPREPSQESSQEEEMRKFFEALGVPQTPRAPTRTAPRPAVQPAAPARGRSLAPRPAPAVQREAPILQAPPSPAATQPPQPVPAVPPGAISDAYWQKTPSDAAPEPLDAAANIRSLLKSSQSIRAAVILREVLGPPLSMRP